jgi:hypothetical protein
VDGERGEAEAEEEHGAEAVSHGMIIPGSRSCWPGRSMATVAGRYGGYIA